MNDATRRYARVLDWGTRIGYLVLLVTFALYVSGAIPAAIPFADLPKLWSLPVDEFLRTNGATAGWSWVGRLHSADYLNYVGVALLAFITLASYAAILPLLKRAGERVFLWIALAEIVVLAVAAAGFGMGH